MTIELYRLLMALMEINALAEQLKQLTSTSETTRWLYELDEMRLYLNRLVKIEIANMEPAYVPANH